MPMPQVDDEFAFREAVSKLLAARLRLSTISGLIPMDSSQLVLFFRTKVCYFKLQHVSYR